MTNRIHTARRLGLLLGAGLASSAPALAQQVLSLQLGRTPATLSAQGEHVAGPGLGAGAAVWAPGIGWEELGGPGGPGVAVSNDGNIVLANGPGGGEIWVRGTGWQALGFPGMQRAMALSSDGRHVAAQADQRGDRPYVWDRQTGALTRVQVPIGALGVHVSGVSLGAIASAGTARFPGGMTRAAVWSADGAVTLVGPAGSAATAVSENGEWAAGVVPSAAGDVPFRWNRSIGRLDLPPLGGAGTSGGYLAKSVSDDGALVIGNRTAVGVPSTGFAWTPAAGTVPFADFLQSEGLGAVGPFTEIVAAASGGRRFLLSDGLALGASNFFNVDAQVSSSFCGPGVPNSTGSAGAVFLLGTNDPDRNGLFLRASDLPVGITVMPIASRDGGFSPMAGGSAGTLCLGGAIGRFAPGQTGAAGEYQVRVDLRAIPTPAGPISGMSGQTWRFQCWYREPGVSASNFTDGARVLLD